MKIGKFEFQLGKKQEGGEIDLSKISVQEAGELKNQGKITQKQYEKVIKSHMQGSAAPTNYKKGKHDDVKAGSGGVLSGATAKGIAAGVLMTGAAMVGGTETTKGQSMKTNEIHASVENKDNLKDLYEKGEKSVSSETKKHGKVEDGEDEMYREITYTFRANEQGTGAKHVTLDVRASDGKSFIKVGDEWRELIGAQYASEPVISEGQIIVQTKGGEFVSIGSTKNILQYN